MNSKDFTKVYDIILTFLKKINKTTNAAINFLKIKNKLHHDELNIYLTNETPEKFVNWLLFY